MDPHVFLPSSVSQRICRRIRTTAGLLLVGLLVGCATPLPADEDLVLSYDGLTPVEGTLMSQVWIREGFSLDGYRRVMLEGADIQYRPRLRNNVVTTPGQPTAAQRSSFENMINEEFNQALTRLTLERVTSPGPDVLLVRGTMLDVVAGNFGEGNPHLDSVGQATFMVEFIDSESHAVLIRALDTRSARMPGESPDDPITEQAVRRVLARWADMLVDALNDLTAIQTLQGT